jgi:hypothetical protein
MHVAMLRFNNACNSFDLKGANLDTAAFNAVSSVLSPRYKTVRLTAPPGAELHTKDTEVNGFFKRFPTIAAQIRALAHPPPSIDAYVLVWARAHHSECLDNPQPYGIGLTKMSGMFGTAVLHAFAQVIVIDAHTEEELGSAWTRDPPTPVPGFDWTGDPAEVSPEQAQQIRAYLQGVFAASVTTATAKLLPPIVQ